MPQDRKGVQNLRTMAGKVDRRKSRTSGGALLELSILANERQRLQQEYERLTRRQAEINARLAEIAEKEARLQGFVQTATPGSETATTVVQPVPLAETPRRISTRELSY